MHTRGAKRKAVTPVPESSSESKTSKATGLAPAPKRNKSSATSDAGAAGTSSVAAQLANATSSNKTIPASLSFPRRPDGTARIAAWNVCGLKTSQKKGFKIYVEAEDPDILILTETKLSDRPIDPYLSDRYEYQYWNDAVKGHGGTAILSKVPALNVTYTIPTHEDPVEVAGRIVTLEFTGMYLIGTYAPNAGEKLKFMDRKKTWNTAFEAHIRSLDAQKPVIWAGDLNVVPTAMDIKRAKPNYNKSAGYTEIEINGFNQILAPSPSIAGSKPLVDIWRQMHPSDEHYTYFSYRFDCRSKGIGWRLDYFIVSEQLIPRVKMCEIRHEVYGASDHLPIVLDLDGQL